MFVWQVTRAFGMNLGLINPHLLTLPLVNGEKTQSAPSGHLQCYPSARGNYGLRDDGLSRMRTRLTAMFRAVAAVRPPQRRARGHMLCRGLARTSR